MGEYAMYRGKEIKIGTCEDMYYLRADQAHLVTALPNNIDPMKDTATLRFRFPFPDEDGTAPGVFPDYDRTLALSGEFDCLKYADHRDIQFVARVGILAMLPCPRSDAGKTNGINYGYNGYAGSLRFGQQRVWEGHLVLVAECGDCGAAFRLETLEQAEEVIVACRSKADRETRDDNPSVAKYWHTIADRITAGYSTTFGSAS